MRIADWSDLRILLEIERRKSFLAAGKALGLSTSTVARRMDALEKALGLPVVHRTSQGVSLEKAALELVTAARAFEQALAAGRRDAAVDTSVVAGTVRISVPDGFGPWLAKPLAQLQRRHPALEVELISELRYVDLSSREADLAVRAGRTNTSELVARLLAEVTIGLYATEAYLERALPKRYLAARDYAEQSFVVEDLNIAERKIPNVLMLRGATRFPFRSNAYEVRVRAAEESLGLVMLANTNASQHPQLRPVQLETAFPTLRFYLTFRRGLRRDPRIRAVTQAILEAAGTARGAGGSVEKL